MGTVVSGFLNRGTMDVFKDTTLLLGPDNDGIFEDVKVSSIQQYRIDASKIHTGDFATLAIKPAIRENSSDLVIRKGMVLIEKNGEIPKSHIKFEARILVLHQVSSMKISSQGIYILILVMIHCGSICQAAKIIRITKCFCKQNIDDFIPKSNDKFCNGCENVNINELVTGDKGIIKFKLSRPEFLKVGFPLLIRDGKNKSVGSIISLG